MLKVIILEGTRGGGKSTVTRVLRNRIEGSTLINPTGFKLNGFPGLQKIQQYYEGLFNMLSVYARSPYDYTLIFDRFFFSEMVYSKLYKDYDFEGLYRTFCEWLFDIADVHIFHLRASKEALIERLVRDKVGLFDQIEESADQSIKQQEGYNDLFLKLCDDYLPKFKFYDLNTSDTDTPEQVADIILKQI